MDTGRRTWTRPLFATIIGADLLIAGYVMGGISSSDLVSSPPADAATRRVDPHPSSGPAPGPQKFPEATTSTTAGHCDGTIAADKVSEVRVPDDATCILEGTTVDSNVSVGHGAALVLRGADVGGDVKAEGARQVTITHGSSIGGDLQLDSGGAAVLTDSHVDGDVEWQGEHGSLDARQNSIGGNLQIYENSGAVTVSGNRIKGDLQCDGNRPAPVGGGNDVSGNREEQCSGV